MGEFCQDWRLNQRAKPTQVCPFALRSRFFRTVEYKAKRGQPGRPQGSIGQCRVIESAEPCPSDNKNFEFESLGKVEKIEMLCKRNEQTARSFDDHHIV